MPVHQARMLVYLATVPSCTYADLSERYNLSGASISRSLNTLERKLEMVDIYRDPAEGRRYRVRLSRKGRALMDSLRGLIEQPEPTTHVHTNREGAA